MVRYQPHYKLSLDHLNTSITEEPGTLSPAKQVRFNNSQTSENPSQFARERRRQHHEQDITWLTGVLAQHPGFDDFIHNHNRRLDNSNIVLHWAFASSVVDDFHLKPSGAPGSSNVSISLSSSLRPSSLIYLQRFGL